MHALHNGIGVTLYDCILDIYTVTCGTWYDLCGDTSKAGQRPAIAVSRCTATCLHSSQKGLSDGVKLLSSCVHPHQLLAPAHNSEDVPLQETVPNIPQQPGTIR